MRVKVDPQDAVREFTDFNRRIQAGHELLEKTRGKDVQIATTPKREVWRQDKTVLYHYTPAAKQTVKALVLVVYAGLLVLTGVQFWRAPGGFIPAQDQGYFITIVQLPPGSSLSRTDAVVQRAIKDLLAIPGVVHTASFSGFDAATSTNASNAAAVFFTVTPFAERAAHGVDGATVLRTARQRMAAIAEANIFVIAPPSVRGLSTTGGFKFIVEDQAARGLPALRDATGQVIAAAARERGGTDHGRPGRAYRPSRSPAGDSLSGGRAFYVPR